MRQTAFRLEECDFELLDDVAQYELLGVGNRSDALRYVLRQYAKDAAGYAQLAMMPLPEREERLRVMEEEANKVAALIVNGVSVETKKSEVSYEDLVRLAGLQEGRVYSAVYSRAADDRSGSLIPGGFVKVADGTVFTIMDTSSA